MPTPEIDRHRILDHDLYRVETRAGERVWLEVPRGTPTRVVKTKLRPKRQHQDALAQAA
jgi:hypothetical protein